MKKILALLVIFAMALVSVPATMANGPCPDPMGDWDDHNCYGPITTTVNVVGGSGGPNGGGSNGGGALDGAPIIKVKWEYDLDVMLPAPDPCCDTYCIYHDACPYIPGLQVKPMLESSVTVGYYAIVTDPQGVGHIDHVYVDVWHPNGEFKYQFELFPVGLTSGGYDKQPALNAWNHVLNWHHTLITYSDFEPKDPSWTLDQDILYELEEEEAYLYYGEAMISYCQPGGFYCVGVRAVDGLQMWSDYLFNQFWYIPTAAVRLDFTSVHYGDAVVSTWLQKGGDKDMDTPNLPTVKNIGNTPVQFSIYQDDMGFGKTGGVWNVEYKARLSKDGVYTDPYWPEQTVGIPGFLGMCTQEKFDFLIHIIKGFPGNTNTGTMEICAHIYGAYDCGENWVSPMTFDPAPYGVPQTAPEECGCPDQEPD